MTLVSSGQLLQHCLSLLPVFSSKPCDEPAGASRSVATGAFSPTSLQRQGQEPSALFFELTADLPRRKPNGMHVAVGLIFVERFNEFCKLSTNNPLALNSLYIGSGECPFHRAGRGWTGGCP